ncbi:glycine--tRNA ligase subunit beta|uniref:Glycine--tRNA ligase beta subunit n=1 Tax=Dendrosporobacter quercicolus TaxID=146817 RepID=A0A1G9MQ39_9FIRM|nr:glycine--tRNA ligase subunit beta [Dendrosporobacter quercicolus]NSL47102.1 glycine--tRNA ligase subunit beta [Dendrosporobacter quercicolus DSM 1736]SDL76213.1 glycyl-tRNA synthetase beta chain [Dendrosporobacter quercicolus]
MTKDLLLEIGTEEIPARFMPDILTQFKTIAAAKLAELRIAHGEVQVVGTPRRLALVVREVVEKQADHESINKGPSVKIAFDEHGQATKAAQGFARGQGVDVSELLVKEGYAYAVVHEAGQSVSQLLPTLLPEMIHALSFPKNMRWADLDLRFVRPIRWLLALFGQEVIPFTIADVAAGNTTFGHRFLSKGPIRIDSVNDYFARLAQNHVMVDQNVRRQVIREQIEKLAQGQGGVAAIDEALLEEVTYLVEYPTALCGSIEEKYLALPPEAVITPMREHQRYFPVVTAAGNLLPVFITVRNGGSDYIDIVRHGNERVLRARLADAQFFFEEDKKIPLGERLEKLKTIVFQEGLGSLYDKTVRLEALSRLIAVEAGMAESLLPDLIRGAQLAKADLVTGMVYEFTELQGIMGREYALLSGETRVAADAIFEHYLPRFAGDQLPVSAAGRAISIADKIDNIVATFSRGLIPTGSQDPYALRRQALGIVHILVDARVHLSLGRIIAQAMDLLAIKETGRREKLANEIQDFFRLRIKNVLADDKLSYDVIDAVVAIGHDDIYDTWLRAKALGANAQTEAMQKTIQAFTRVGNLAKHAAGDQVDRTLFSTEAEAGLYEAYLTANARITQSAAKHDYCAVLASMAALAAPIDAFFDAVMVMAEDSSVRNNRLALLNSIAGLTTNMADFSKIVTG